MHFVGTWVPSWSIHIRKVVDPILGSWSIPAHTHAVVAAISHRNDPSRLRSCLFCGMGRDPLRILQLPIVGSAFAGKGRSHKDPDQLEIERLQREHAVICRVDTQ